MTAFHYKPDMIYNIDPAPEYPDEPVPPTRKIRMERHEFKKGLERFRDNSLVRNRHSERFVTGRLYAHLKHEEMKETVRELKEKEL